MKKLLALTIILAFVLTGCGLIDTPSVTPGGDTSQTDTPSGNTPSADDTADCPTVECASHKDADDDGICDVCEVTVIICFDFYSVNDLHGKLTEDDSQAGVGGLTTYLMNKQSENPYTVVLSAGDMWQGTALSGLSFGGMMTEWMNGVGFVSMTLGNHEFDWGDSYIYDNLEIAEFPFLAINIFDRDTDEQMEYCQSSIIVDKGEIQIGIIGAIGDCYSSISADMSAGFYFKVGDELTELVKAESEKLRADGADFIIYSLHDGGSGKYNLGSYYDTELSDGYVDLVFEGHSHKSYSFTDSYGVVHLQGGGENYGISHAAFNINSANGNHTLVLGEVLKSSKYSSLDTHESVDALLLEYKDAVDKTNETLGYNSEYRDDSDLEQLVSQLYYEYGVQRWGDEYDVILGGGFLRTRSPYNLYTGEVIYADLYSLLPFNNDIVLCSIKGSDLLSKFINSTNSDYYVYYGDNDVSGIVAENTYYIVTDSYTSTYRYNNLTEIERGESGVYARDLVADFVKRGEWA